MRLLFERYKYEYEELRCFAVTTPISRPQATSTGIWLLVFDPVKGVMPTTVC